MAKIKVVSDYEWKPRFTGHAGIAAAVVMEHFDRLSKTYLGKVRPQDLLDHIRPKSHPLHNLAEWDNAIAGEEYRVIQMRQVLANIIVRVKLPDPKQQEPVIIRAIVNVREDGEQGYMRGVDPDNPEELERLILHSSLREAHHFARTYELLPQAKNQVESMRVYLETYEDEAKEAGINLHPPEPGPQTFRLGKGKLKVYTQVKPRHQSPVTPPNFQEPQAGFEAGA